MPKDAVVTEQILTGFDYATHIKKANEILEKELKKEALIFKFLVLEF
ncbi:hypothetical protein [Campylobacter sp.]|nr:hypothetical protein [Campylobacter sp.]MCI7581318.1 hypothetical protein [Campylobacter sp.]